MELVPQGTPRVQSRIYTGKLVPCLPLKLQYKEVLLEYHSFTDGFHFTVTVSFTGDGKGTRNMWNDGKQIIWNHFSRIVFDDLNYGLKIGPKLTQEHAQLNPYSCMNVRLAAQTLSSTVASILKEYYPAETHGALEL